MGRRGADSERWYGASVIASGREGHVEGDGLREGDEDGEEGASERGGVGSIDGSGTDSEGAEST